MLSGQLQLLLLFWRLISRNGQCDDIPFRCWLKSLNNASFEPTNQNSLKVTKVVKPKNKITRQKTLGITKKGRYLYFNYNKRNKLELIKRLTNQN